MRNNRHRPPKCTLKGIDQAKADHREISGLEVFISTLNRPLRLTRNRDGTTSRGQKYLPHLDSIQYDLHREGYPQSYLIFRDGNGRIQNRPEMKIRFYHFQE